MAKHLKIVILLCVCRLSFSQTVHGTIVSTETTPLNATVLFKQQLAPEYIKEYTIAKDGTFQKKLQQAYESLLIEVKAAGFYNESITIASPKKDTTYTYNFILIKKKEYTLEEVVVFGKQKRFEIRKDTVSFNVSRYKDGSERKIEEVIRKLPGVELDDQTGEIKYKGKPVETVTLDGDNLFGYNYALGTKNINVDIVEQIEAIDNYTENPLLKGIEQGGKVALNLKLKKEMLDLSGNMDIGSGRFEDGTTALDLNSNALGLTKTYKSFATLAYNNVGINRSPFDYFGFKLNVEQQKERNYFAKKIIPETRFSNVLEDRRANVNNQFFGNYNAIFKPDPKLRIKTNLFFIQDKITANRLLQNDFEINAETFVTSDNTLATKKPQQYRGDLEIKYNTSKTSLLEYTFRVRQENIETPTNVVQNQTEVFATHLDTEDLYVKQRLLFTKKFSERKAFQASLFHSFNGLPQRFSITPSLFDISTEGDVQESEFKNTFLEGRATHLFSGEKDKYSFTYGANASYSPYTSQLSNSNGIVSGNNFDYKQYTIFNTGTYNFNREDWQISPSYSVRFFNQTLDENLEYQAQNSTDFIFEPFLTIKYKLDLISSLTANFGLAQNPNSPKYFFSNPVLIDNRTSIENIPSLELQSVRRYSLSYLQHDLNSQFQLVASIGLRQATGNFFTNQNITENATQITYFFLPQDNTNWNMNTHISKYLPFLESRVKLSSNYTISNFKNVVNNSELRQNSNQFLMNSFVWNTAFDIPINFENTLTYRYSNSKSETQSAFTNASWQNSFEIIAKPNNVWYFIISTDYYVPNTDQSNSQFFFLDATLRHRPTDQKWEASLVLQNLTNENNFVQVQTSDISTTIFRSNLLPRYFSLHLSWNF